MQFNKQGSYRWVMASGADSTTEAEIQLKEESEQLQRDVDHRLLTLSDRINMCDVILKDLRDLSDLQGKKLIQDASLPQQE